MSYIPPFWSATHLLLFAAGAGQISTLHSEGISLILSILPSSNELGSLHITPSRTHTHYYKIKKAIWCTFRWQASKQVARSFTFIILRLASCNQSIIQNHGLAACTCTSLQRPFHLTSPHLSFSLFLPFPSLWSEWSRDGDWG